MKRFAVMGHPLKHSLSPAIHRLFSEETQRTLEFVAVEVSPAEFQQTLLSFFAAGGFGVGITAPFKHPAYKLCTQITARAKRTGSVNCLKKIKDDIWGDNTDGVGFIADLIYQHESLKNKTVLLIGAGGAAAGILGPIIDAQPKRLILTNRTLSTCSQLLQPYSLLSNISICPIEQLAHDEPADVIINATSSHYDNSVWPFPNIPLTSATFCYDLAYGKTPTPFQLWAQQQSARTTDGLGMLIEQAAEAFYFWHGIKPDTAHIREKLNVPK